MLYDFLGESEKKTETGKSFALGKLQDCIVQWESPCWKRAMR